MPEFNKHVNAATSARTMLTNRFSRHPERYFEILRVIRKYELHHVAAEFGMAHRHEEEDDGLLLDLTKLAYVHRVAVPSTMTLLGKAMLNLDGTIRVLSPELDPVQLIRDYMLEVMEKRGMAQLAAGRVFAWAIDMKHLVENAPRRADMILEKLANDQLTARLEVNDLEWALKSVNGAVNRLSLGMVASALIVGGGYVLGALIKQDGANKGFKH